MAFRRGLEFTWKPIKRIAEDSVSSLNTSSGGSATPPPAGNNFLLLNGSPMLLLNGNDFGLL